jgi:hypothetical protein
VGEETQRNATRLKDACALRIVKYGEETCIVVGEDTQCEAETTQKSRGKVNPAGSLNQGSVELIRQGGDGLGFIRPGRPKEIGCVLAEGGLQVDGECSGFGTGPGYVGQEEDHTLADRQSIEEIPPRGGRRDSGP